MDQNVLYLAREFNGQQPRATATLHDSENHINNREVGGFVDALYREELLGAARHDLDNLSSILARAGSVIQPDVKATVNSPAWLVEVRPFAARSIAQLGRLTTRLVKKGELSIEDARNPAIYRLIAAQTLSFAAMIGYMHDNGAFGGIILNKSSTGLANEQLVSQD